MKSKIDRIEILFFFIIIFICIFYVYFFSDSPEIIGDAAHRYQIIKETSNIPFFQFFYDFDKAVYCNDDYTSICGFLNYRLVHGMRLGIVLPASLIFFIVGENIYSYYAPQIITFISTSILIYLCASKVFLNHNINKYFALLFPIIFIFFPGNARYAAQSLPAIYLAFYITLLFYILVCSELDKNSVFYKKKKFFFFAISTASYLLITTNIFYVLLVFGVILYFLFIKKDFLVSTKISFILFIIFLIETLVFSFIGPPGGRIYILLYSLKDSSTIEQLNSYRGFLDYFNYFANRIIGIISNIFSFDFIKLIPKRFFHYNYPLENFFMSFYLSILIFLSINFSKLKFENLIKLNVLIPIPLLLVFIFLLQDTKEFTFHIKPLMRYNYPLFILFINIFPFLIIYLLKYNNFKNYLSITFLLSFIYGMSFVNATDNKILEIRNNASYQYSEYYLNHQSFKIQDRSIENFKKCRSNNCLIYLDMPIEHNLEAQTYVSLFLGVADYERFAIKPKGDKFIYNINSQISYDHDFVNELVISHNMKDNIFDRNNEFLGINSYFKSNKPVSINCISRLSLIGRNYFLNEVSCEK